jgi:hypothetical protein
MDPGCSAAKRSKGCGVCRERVEQNAPGPGKAGERHRRPSAVRCADIDDGSRRDAELGEVRKSRSHGCARGWRATRHGQPPVNPPQRFLQGGSEHEAFDGVHGALINSTTNEQWHLSLLLTAMATLTPILFICSRSTSERAAAAWARLAS